MNSALLSVAVECLLFGQKMNHAIDNTIMMVLGGAALIALGVALYSLVFMVVRWKTPERRRHVIRLLLATAAIPCIIGIQQAFLWLVILPALGREQMAQIDAARAESSLVEVGDLVPDFSLAIADGGNFSMSDAKGDVVLVNFFATWCGPCKLELPHIDQIWAENRGNDHFRLLVIGREESLDSVREFRDKNGFSFPIAPDPECAAYSLFATEYIPRTYLVSSDGRICFASIGFYEEDMEQLESELAKQLRSIR